jgi:four helix bundle protein
MKEEVVKCLYDILKAINAIERFIGEKRDFTNFMNHALKSANESLYWVRLVIEAKGMVGDLSDAVSRETEELGNILAASILTLKGRRR